MEWSLELKVMLAIQLSLLLGTTSIQGPGGPLSTFKQPLNSSILSMT